jgi:TonB family protein
VSAAYWLGNLAAWSVQSAVLIAAGGVAAWAFQVRVPRIRLAYWQTLLALCLLLPAVEPWRSAAASNIEFTTMAARPVSPNHTRTFLPPWREALLLLLASGCAARALWLAVGFGKLRRWRRDARVFSPLPPRLDLLRAAVAPHADFRLSPSLSGPVTFGLWRPVVVLPGRFDELPGDIQEAVVCHELLHVRRRDWIVTVAEQAIRAALWFHPAVWWLIGQAQLAREQTVDGEAVALTGNREQYLNALLAMAGNRPALDLAPAALFLRKRHLKNRVALLLNLKEVTMSKRTLISFCATSCGVLFAAGWLALHTFPLQAAPVPQEAAQSNLLHSVAPKYPQAAREKHIEGPVVLEVHIDAEGHVSDAKVISGQEELRSAALEAVLQWHYSPQAMTLPAITQVTMKFKLPKDGAPAPPESMLQDGKRVTLKSVTVEDLTPAARDELLQRLPVHQGDTLDADGMRAVMANVLAFDEHLRVVLLLDPSNENSGRLRISLAPAGAPAATKIRVGGNVQQAKLLVKVQPVYPPEAKMQGIEGTVVLQAMLDKGGKVEDLQVLSGDPMLAAAALEAVRQWQYATTLLNGDPVEVVTEIRVNFTLAK